MTPKLGRYKALKRKKKRTLDHPNVRFAFYFIGVYIYDIEMVFSIGEARKFGTTSYLLKHGEVNQHCLFLSLMYASYMVFYSVFGRARNLCLIQFLPPTSQMTDQS